MRKRHLIVLISALAMVFAMLGPISTTSSAAPTSPVDETKVPHYFGPYPNWANSPFTYPDAPVTITGDGTGAEAVATVGANGAVTGITITDPGSGYTDAQVVIGGAGTGAFATAEVTALGAVTGVEVTLGGLGYVKPVVHFSGGGAQGTVVQVGNALGADRAYATDSPDPVFVILKGDPLPAGTLQAFQVRNQATAGGSPYPSAGQTFTAYILHPTGAANEYTVVFESAPLTMPALQDPAVSEIATFDVADQPVLAGDLIAFYGRGVPTDINTGTDFISVAPAAPTGTFTAPGPGFPDYGQARDYAFSAQVLDSTGVQPVTEPTATAYGGITGLELTNGGFGYTQPTIDFDMPDAPGGVQATAHIDPTKLGPNGEITQASIVIDTAGSGYSQAPGVVIRDGTIYDPLPHDPGTFAEATARATLSVQSVVLETFGAGYRSAPTVTFGDAGGEGSGAEAVAAVDAGAVTSITLDQGGSGYVTGGGIQKFVDTLPLLGPDGANNLGQYIPVAQPDQETFPDDPSTPRNEAADYYEIAVVEYEERMHSDLEPTTLRGYVQLDTAKIPGDGVPLFEPDGVTPILMPDGITQAVGVDEPHYLGPAIVADRNRAVRITFFNLLPKDEKGDLFLPVDSTIMGSGPTPGHMMPMDEGTTTDQVRNPMCTDDRNMMDHCFAKNRATLHLHGGNTPWISDGTPHQWITPAGESMMWPEGVSVASVPDMVGQAAIDRGIPDCSGPDDGCQTFYYTNQQSARLMFYHDHSWGITRLNVYAGEAAPYIIGDATERRLVQDLGVLPDAEHTIPLVIQDRTFVPDAEQLAWQDPTWDAARWGDRGDLWYHHVYMPAQNPGAPGGMSGFGRWMYSPWFWPPQDPKYDPIANPYYDMDPEGPDGIRGTTDDFSSPLTSRSDPTVEVDCDLDDPDTWQYDEEPFCEPELIPSTPNISAGMEQFNDTPVVNGTAYPTVTLEPKAYRLRILNAANDRFWNLQWYIADPSTASTALNALGETIGGTEVALKPAELEAAQADPVVFPTPVHSAATDGPDWVAFGNEGGLLPHPVVVDGQQETTWVQDPTLFGVGLVDQHSLLLAPAERADAVVDFSKFAGETLILYNDAPAAFPARIPSYDYYTGAPDLTPVGAPSILPGYGPNTRTILQVKIAGAADPAFNVNALRNAFSHKANGTGAFEQGQHPIIVGQAQYNSAYGTSFVTNNWCNGPKTKGTAQYRCDGFARISEQGGTLFGFNGLRQQYSPGVGKLQVPIEPKAIQDETSESNFDEFGRMSAVLGVEIVPAQPGIQNTVLYPFTGPPVEIFDTSGLPVADVTVTPVSSAQGIQIWKITHNGVDTHPIHVHAYDVQVINRVNWDNVIKPPDETELGWKETIRVSPLEDTYFAIRPVVPRLPFDLPNSVRLLSPMMADGEILADATNADLQGLPITSFAPNGEPIDVVNHYVNFGAEYVYHCHILSHEEMDMMRPVSLAFPPIAPSGLTTDLLSLVGNGGRIRVSFTDNSLSETSFVLQKRETGSTGAWTDVAAMDRFMTGGTTGEVLSLEDGNFRINRSFEYRVVAVNTVGDTWDYADPNLNGLTPGQPAFPTVSLKAASASIIVPPAPAKPTNLTGTAARAGNNERVTLTWTDNSEWEQGFQVQRSTDPQFLTGVATVNVGPAAGTGTLVTYTTGNISRVVWYFRVQAYNVTGGSGYTDPILVPAAA